jgi:hypothetical protein
LRKEVKNTKRKLVLGTVLALSLSFIIAVAAVFPAFASGKKKPDPTVEAYNSGNVGLDLPPPGGAPPPAGVAGHPTNLLLLFIDYYKGPASGTDVIVVFIWVSALNKYIPIAAIADQPANAQVKTYWNNTPVYLEIDNVVIRNNLKTVADEELNVWTECARGHNDILTANLTVPVGPLDYTGLPSIFGSTFTVPAMDATFRQTAESYRETETEILPDGSTEKTTYIRVPAYVTVHASAWFNYIYWDVGMIVDQKTTITPP